MALALEQEITLPNGTTFTQPTGLFINNEFIPSISGRTFDSINPETGKVNSAVYEADAEDIDVAVAAAKAAFKPWKKTTGVYKGELLNELARLMKENVETLSAVESWDGGKPRVQNAKNDIAMAIDCVKYYAGWADKVLGKVIQNDPEKLVYTIQEPYGVCGQIIPWNFPVLMAIWKLAPALAAGNVIVLKTSEVTPLSMLYVATLIKKAGFPPGVVNIVSGFGSKAGRAIAAHLDIAKVAFTGSTATGKLIQQVAAVNLKAVTLECGGKSPLIVRADADLDQAVKWAAIGIMYNQGQICTSTSRIYVQESIYDKFIEAYAAHVAERYTQGSVFDDSVAIGPQVSKQQRDSILSYIEIGKKEGARVVLGGETNTSGALSDGFYIKPTIFADAKQDMRIVKEEIFGPVVAVGKFSTDEEALALANDSEYGLGAAVFTKDLGVAHRLAAEIEAGMVWINSSNDSDCHVPFGGVKMSGVGRELGEYGLSIYSQAKSVHVNLGHKV